MCFTVPYLVGRISGGDIMRVIEMKYPKALKALNYGHDNNLFASYISRAVVVVPGDLVSMIHGALRMPYRPYLLGSIMGVIPEMLARFIMEHSLTFDNKISACDDSSGCNAGFFAEYLIKGPSRSSKQMDKEDFDICTKKRTDNNNPHFLLFVKLEVESVEIFLLSSIS